MLKRSDPATTALETTRFFFGPRDSKSFAVFTPKSPSNPSLAPKKPPHHHLLPTLTSISLLESDCNQQSTSPSNNTKMPPPTPLAIATGSLQRLVKEEASYHKELVNQEARLEKLLASTEEDENKEYSVKQQVGLNCSF